MLPITLKPEAGPALVVGAGKVAKRRIKNLLKAEFSVTVVAPSIADEIDQSAVTVLKREFESGDLDGHAVIFACTNSRNVNQAVSKLARSRKLPIVVSDSREESTFFAPAVHRDGDLTIAVSTGGASPKLAVEIRDQIAEYLGSGWGEKVESARKEREAESAQ